MLICTVVTILDDNKNANVKGTVFIVTSENFKVFHGIEYCLNTHLWDREIK